MVNTMSHGVSHTSIVILLIIALFLANDIISLIGGHVLQWCTVTNNVLNVLPSVCCSFDLVLLCFMIQM